MDLGITAFDGNRGSLYTNDPPTFGLSVHYFSDFQSSWGVGFAFSKHSYFLNSPTVGFSDGPGYVSVSMFRTYMSYRYYIDTSNLGTAITYSNPYFTTRLEYWYVTSKYEEPAINEPDEKGGGIGIGIGGGLEFPIKLKESYINIELMIHDVAFHDKYTRKLSPKPPATTGVDDLSGYAYTTTVGYVWSW
jgi:hypothetical protein